MINTYEGTIWDPLVISFEINLDLHIFLNGFEDFKKAHLHIYERTFPVKTSRENNIK